MRVLALCLFLVALSGASADAASFGAAETIGAGPALATAAVAGGAGTFAVVVRQQGAIVGAVRRGNSAAWQMRTLARSNDWSLRDPQIVMDGKGTITALWTAELPHPSLVAARAPSGAGFGAAHVVARLNDAAGASPRMLVMPSGRVLVTFQDRSLIKPRTIGAQARLKTIQLDHGHASAVRDLGIEGAYPAIARAGGGAVLVYVAGMPRCKRSVCAPRAARATLLDRAGRRSGPTITVAGDAYSWRNVPRVTSAGTRAIVSWVQPGTAQAPTARAFTREYRTGPLRAAGLAQPFPIYGGPGVGTPSIAILPDGDLLGANVANSGPGESFGGKAELSLARRGTGWQAPTVLSAPEGWTTVPRMAALSGGGALAVFARSRFSAAGRLAYDVTAVERSPAGAIAATTLGSSLGTNNAGGLSVSVADDGQAIVTWPNANGGIDVALRT